MTLLPSFTTKWHHLGLLTLATSLACSSPAPSSATDADPTARTRVQRLQDAQTWMYQIQDLNDPAKLATLAATDYPLLVIEPGQNFTDSPYDMANIISTLRTAPDGTERLLLAYVDIGQAEDYRDYWESNWVAPTENDAGDPDFLLTIDPDGWSGNYVVAYWDPAWKNMWTGNFGIVAPDEMFLFIEEMDTAGEAVSEDFLIVAQNAPYLLDEDPARYGQIMDALAVEDTWWHGDGDVPWDDPRAGDLHERHDGDYTTPNRLAQYKKYTDRNIPVFTVDYCLSEQNAADVYRDSRALGLRPLVTQVPLSQNTDTPPSDF
jgi:cysteinyl-tRNA synthetase